jgi:hypothetical protein
MTDAFQLPFASREARIAHNESWARSLNQRIAEWASGRSEAMNFRCECWEADCSERIRLSPEDWRRVRSEPTQFAVAPHHVAKGFEAVIKECDGFWLVKKFGEAGRVAGDLATADHPDDSSEALSPARSSN